MSSWKFEALKCELEDITTKITESLLKKNRKWVLELYGRVLHIQLDMRWSKRGKCSPNP